MADTNAQLDRLNKKSSDKNYMTIFTKKEEQEFIKTVHPIEAQEETEYIYDQKAARDRNYNPRHRLEETKDLYKAPLTSNQSYGWRAPIDNFPTNFGMKSTLGESLVKPQEKSNKPRLKKHKTIQPCSR